MFLTAEELRVLTGRTFKRLQIEALRKMGIPFFVNAMGRAIVARTAIEGNGKAASATPPKQGWMPRVLSKEK